MVKTQCFHCRGPGLDPWSGNQDPISLKVQSKKEEKKSSTKNSQAEQLSFWLLPPSSETCLAPLLWPGPPPQTNLYLDTAPFYQIMLQR